MSRHPNIILIAIDSLRRDHMSLYGYERLTTPHISRFADGGTIFNQTFSPSIPTTPGYASMLTGLDCFGTDVVALRHKNGLREELVTLPEMLAASGYETTCVGFQGNPSSRGFGNYLSYEAWASDATGQAPKAELLNDVTIPELKRLASGSSPFFLFMRHMDPHSPYLPPRPFMRMFYDGDEFDKDNRSLDEVYAFAPFADYFKSWFPEGLTDRNYLTAQYDAAVAYMDSCIANIFETVRSLGIGEDTLVILTSDHGETLDEHNCYYDHHGVYDCTLVVPLVLRWPGHVPAGLRIPHCNQLKDLVPTILELAGLAPRISFDGRSLVPWLRGDDRAPEPEMYLTEATWMRKHGWRTPEWKLIHALEPDFHFKPEIELYNLVTDPGENENLAEAEPEIVAMLERRMGEHIRRREAAVGRENPMFTNLDWHALGTGPFTSSQQAYDSLHIGSRTAARTLQAKAAEKNRAARG